MRRYLKYSIAKDLGGFMNKIIKWYEYMIFWSIPILLVVISLFNIDFLNEFHIDNIFLSINGIDLLIISATTLIYIAPFIEKSIIRYRFRQFEFVRYKNIRLSELIFVIIWIAASLAIMLWSSIRPYYLFTGVFWNYRNLVLSQLYLREDKIIIKNKIYYIDSQTVLLDDTGNSVLVKSKDNNVGIFCGNQLIKKAIITLLTKNNMSYA